MSLETLEETVFEFENALRSYHNYTERELYGYLQKIEEIVDAIILQYRPSKPTDFKFRTFNDMLGEYENVMKALREALMSKDYIRARALLSEVAVVVRRLSRNLSFLAADMYIPTAEGARELENYIGEGKVAEHIHEFDERLKELSHTARSIFAWLFRSPMREVNLQDLPVKIGLTEKGSKKIINDAVEELVRRLPDLVEILPDTVRGGLKIKLKRW